MEWSFPQPDPRIGTYLFDTKPDPWSNQRHYQAYKHIFTSPSSVEKEPKATRSGNARIHGMTRVTMPSVAYVATQVSLPIFFMSPTRRP